MKYLSSALIIIISISLVWGTAQVHDNLIIGKDTLLLNTNLVDKYFELYPEKRIDIRPSSTANWKGYITFFELRNDSIYLNDIYLDGVLASENKSVKNEKVESKQLKIDIKTNEIEIQGQSTQRINKLLFNTNDAVFANWITATTVIPIGKLIEYVHMGYESKYEKYRLFQICSGIVTKDSLISYDEFERISDKLYESYKKTSKYIDDIKGIKDTTNIDKYLKMAVKHELILNMFIKCK